MGLRVVIDQPFGPAENPAQNLPGTGTPGLAVTPMGVQDNPQEEQSYQVLTETRRSIDVASVFLGELPDGFTVEEIEESDEDGLAGDYQAIYRGHRISFTGVLPDDWQALRDGLTGQPGGAILFPFSTQVCGVFELESYSEGEDDEVTLSFIQVQHRPVWPDNTGGRPKWYETECRVLGGGQYSSRVFLLRNTMEVHTPTTPFEPCAAILLPQPMLIHPSGDPRNTNANGRDPLDGTVDGPPEMLSAYGVDASVLMSGRVNLIDTSVGSGTLAFSMRAPTGEIPGKTIANEHFALKVTDASGAREVSITAPSGHYFEGLDGAAFSSFSAELSLGAYLEWEFDRSTATWRLLHARGAAEIAP